VRRGGLREIALKFNRGKRMHRSRALCSLSRKDIDHAPPLERLHHRFAPTRRGSIAFRLALSVPSTAREVRRRQPRADATLLTPAASAVRSDSTWSSSARDVYAAPTTPFKGDQRLVRESPILDIRSSQSGHQYVCNNLRHRRRRDSPSRPLSRTWTFERDPPTNSTKLNSR
jgi:hypothetical protein